MKKYAILIGAFVLIVVATLWVTSVRTVNAPGPQACTMEAKLCPDGSAVGRTGPNCEFAECPSSATTTTTTTTTSTSNPGIGMSTTIRGTTIRVLSLVEDSRCPADVQCIWAGTVRVRVSIDSYGEFTLTLDEPQDVGNVTVTLVGVTYAPKSATQFSDYRFVFAVVPKAAGISPMYLTGVRGAVTLGPTCPVERVPPDPACADKPYATTVVVHSAGSSSVFATGKSDASGVFEFALPPGSYTLNAGDSAMLPRCSRTDVSVSSSGYASVHISCDTGIR
ncbi:MAG: hypothetical protein WAV50_01055 [Minisyncoccia bacterium]